LESVIEVNVFLSDINDFPAMNAEYSKYWGNTKPARTYENPPSEIRFQVN
jgi:enamine deaminase RidA (YjgF/YER057c/UK114 family)